ncbi:MAG: DUF5696 domain-containing protein [Acutalibacteraceae bacterium]|nr:DUF5696 domain-containing protein [Acutalibacteraceae bacterium]
MFKKIISVLMMAAIILSTLTFSSCGEIESKNPERPDFIPTVGTSVSDLYSDNYRLVGENNDLQLYFNDDTTDIKIVNKKTKFEWTSEYYDSETDEYYKGQVLTLQYTDKTGAENEKSTDIDSVEQGQFKIDDIENGVSVQYGIGDVGYEIKFPMALSVERFNAFIEKLGADSSEAYTLNDYYTLYDFTTEEARAGYDKDSLAMMMKSYKKANDEPWYYMSGSTTFDDVQTLNTIFASVGYTDEEFESDNKNADVPDVEPVEFNVRINYTLTDKGLSVTIPEKEIYYNEDYPLESITVFPNLMDFDNSAEGYFFLPDGSGSIMEFNNNKEQLRDKSVYVQMYGVDASRVVDEKTAYYNDAIFPVFGTCVKGIKNKKNKGNFAEKNYNGLFGIIESGETFAGIEANNFDAEAGKHNTMKLEFRVNERVRMDAFTASGDTDEDTKYCKYQFQRFLGDIKFNLNVLSGENATYSGMADYYSNYLFGDTANTTAKDYYSTVETVGIINTVEKFFGIEYNTKETLTSFEQIANIASELQQNGFNNMNIKLSGWCNGGYEHGMLDDGIDISSGIGGDDGLVSLYKSLNEKGIGLYPDIDFQNSYVAEEKPSKDYRASTLNGKNSVVSTYSPVDFIVDEKLNKYVLSKDGFTKNLKGFMEDYKEYGINNISYRSIGSEINSNFRDDESYMERQETLENLVSLVQSTKDDGYSIMGTAGQAAYLGLLDVVNELPVESAHFDKCDYSVPFTAMVLSGHVDYTYKPINLSNNNRKDLLLLIESGAGAYYKLTATKYDKLSNTSYDSMYSTVYSEIKDQVIDTYSYVSEALDGVYGLKIVKHEKIADDVYKTTYENGTGIYVNYSDKDYKADGIKVSAQDYFKVKGAAE